MGRPIDLLLNDRACVEAIVVPSCEGGLIGLIKPNRDGIAIPWKNVRQIGDDVILVELESSGIQVKKCSKNPKKFKKRLDFK